ncbi:hypothetical protein F4818DRAFT_109147 [Hypoxylon cercidicola]|nr:hypothetical protein F4818DRAFT_109147 [Hypoxylon cercidicola]
MYARLRSQIPTPVRSDPAQQKSAFKRRLLIDDDDDDEDSARRPSTPKRQRHARYSAAPIFDKHKRPRVYKDDSPHRFYNRRRHLSSSPDPDPPLVSEVNERYANLRVTLHSAALAGLEEAEADIAATAGAKFRANRQALAAMDGQLGKLHAPLRDLIVDYTATDSHGRERTAAIAISEAAATFEEKLEATSTEIDGLWAS